MKVNKQDFRKILAIFFSVASISYMGCITFCEIPKANINNANIILGFLISTALSTIIGFYFGGIDEENGNSVSKKQEDG